MDRINSIGTTTVGGIRQWQNKNLLADILGTQTNATYENDFQEEFVHGFIEAAGLTPTAGVQNQVASAAALMFGGMVGTMRNASMIVAAASASATFTADEIVVAKTLGGFSFKIGSFSRAINLATTGAGGMDTGTAPVSGYVAIYAIYNPTTKTAALLATNATSAVAPSVYGGAYLPAGYTYSALVSVWPTNASKQLVIGVQNDRRIKIVPVNAVSGGSFTGVIDVSIASAVPLNANSCSGNLSAGASTASNWTLEIFSTSGGVGGQPLFAGNASVGINTAAPFSDLLLPTAQNIFISVSNSAGTFAYSILVNGYTF